MQSLPVGSTYRTLRLMQSSCLLMLLSEVTRQTMGLPVPGKLLSAVFVRYATKMAYLYIKTQCASSPVELRINISKKILNRSPLNNAKHQTLIKYVCNRKRQVHVPALITTQLGLRKTLYHHSVLSKSKH